GAVLPARRDARRGAGSHAAGTAVAAGGGGRGRLPRRALLPVRAVALGPAARGGLRPLVRRRLLRRPRRGERRALARSAGRGAVVAVGAVGEQQLGGARALPPRRAPGAAEPGDVVRARLLRGGDP